MAKNTARKISYIPITKARINLGSLVRRVRLNKEYFILEKDGIPVAGIMDADELEDYLELQNPKVRRMIQKSNEDIRAGRTRPAEKLLAELRRVLASHAKPSRRQLEMSPQFYQSKSGGTMSNQELRVDIGDPEFRSRVYQKYRTAIESMRGLVALASKISTTQPVSETLHKVIGRIACIVSNSLGAVVILVLNGYGNDAMKIVRSMFEGAVNASYLKQHPEQLQDYLDHTWIRQMKRLNYMRRYAPDQLQRISAEKVAETERKYKSVVNRFTNRRGKLRGSWTKVPLGQRAEEVGMGQLYLTFYDWVSSMQHLDIGGLSLQTEAGTFAVDVAPSHNWIEEALVVGHGSAVQVLSHYNEIAQLGMDKEMEAIKEGFKMAWKK